MNHWRGAAAALAATALWWVLAAGNPTSTYHFAPMIVAGAWVALEGMSEAGLTPRMSVRLAAAGFAAAAIVTVLLELAGNLDGPVFWEHGDDAPVVAEHLLFAALGAVGGSAVAVRRAFRVSN